MATESPTLEDNARPLNLNALELRLGARVLFYPTGES